MSKRLALPLCILIAAVVGYVRWQGVMSEPPTSYPELVQATQPAGLADAGSALPCTAQWLTPPPAQTVSDAGARRAAVLDALMKKPTPLTAGERDLVLHWKLEAEVLSGGFHPFFFGATGDEALATREAIVHIGPPELLPLYDCALSAFPDGGPSTSRDERNAQLARWGAAQFGLFAPLETHFRALPLDEAAERFIAGGGHAH